MKESESSHDISDEEAKDSESPARLKSLTDRASIRVMRSSTRFLAKGDKLDKEVADVLKRFYSNTFIGYSYSDI